MLRCNNLVALRQLFIDGLDDDPTFDSYRPSYDFVCKYVNIFEQHKDITPFKSNLTDGVNNWTKTYYTHIKNDMSKNFSKERFEHMIEIAPISYCNRRLSILDERGVDVFSEFIKGFKGKTKDELEKIIVEGVRNNLMCELYIPDEYFTESLCWLLLKNDVRSIRNIPKELITLGMAGYIVKENGILLRQIPNELKTKFVCTSAVEENTRALYFVPQELLKDVIASNHITLELAKNCGIIDSDILDMVKEVNNTK